MCELSACFVHSLIPSAKQTCEQQQQRSAAVSSGIIAVHTQFNPLGEADVDAADDISRLTK